MNNYVVKTKDPVVIKLIQKLDERSLKGQKEYGTTLADNYTDDFFNHLLEELLDGANYVMKLKHDEANMPKETKTIVKCLQ